MKIKKVLFLICLCFAFCANGQDITEILMPDKNTTYMGQTGSNGKEKNGMGILKLKKGGVYAGDFSRDNFHGQGIEIAPQNKNIDKCGDATIYVGRWFRGKKEGKGRLYDKNGNLIYDGKFSENQPVGLFKKITDTNIKFSIVEIDEELYVGETKDDIPDGFGIFLDDEGYYTLCPVSRGMKNGIGIMLLPPDSWGVFNIENELYYPLATSKEQNQRRAQYKENRDRDRAELLNTFSNLLTETLEISSNIVNIVGSSKNDGDVSEADYSTSGSASSGSSSKSGGKNGSLSSQQNYNSDKATYAKYDSMLSAVFAGNREAKPSEVQQWQSKMKSLRQKWESQGKSFPHSSNEDK